MADRDSQNLGEIFARNVRLRRAQSDLSQAELARRMKEKGFAFHQQTVQRIEDGVRPVRLEEAYALANIFGTSLDIMSFNLETMRAREVQTWAFGALAVSTGVYDGRDEWLKDARNLHSQAQWEREKYPERTRRLMAAAELLRRQLDMKPRLDDFIREIEETFFVPIERLMNGAEDESKSGDDEVDEVEEARDRDAKEAEAKFRRFVAEAPTNATIRSLSLEDVARIYIRPDDDSARKLLGSDFGAEPTWAVDEEQGMAPDLESSDVTND